MVRPLACVGKLNASSSYPQAMTTLAAPDATRPTPQTQIGGKWRRRLTSQLAEAGIVLNGDNPWDPQVHAKHESHMWARVRSRGLTGLGEAYVDGHWDCDDLAEMFRRLLVADVPARFGIDAYTAGYLLRETFTNRQRSRAASRNIATHYDQPLRLFIATLDPRMTYTCGYWSWPNGERAPNLAAAQEAKLDLVCRKLGITEGMRILDIGCGWGSFVRFAAERYGARCVGITLSAEQRSFALESCRDLPVEIQLLDYRKLPATQEFDRVVSIGMFEHVGSKNYDDFFEAARRSLGPDGLMLLHCFATCRPQPSRRDSESLWVEHYIFPGMIVPDLGRTAGAFQRVGFVAEDLHNIGADYAPTLRAWEENFCKNWEDDPALRALYGEEAGRFYRLWRYYLLLCAGAFESRKYHLWQLVLSPGGVPGGYATVR